MTPSIERKLNVLLVDDCRHSRALVETFLRDPRIHLLTAESAREGIEIVKGNNIHYILMDIQMPEMDGCEATRAIRHWEHFHGHQPIPITALTSHSSHIHLKHIYDSGCTHYLMKPISRVILLQTLNQAASQMDLVAR